MSDWTRSPSGAIRSSSGARRARSRNCRPFPSAAIRRSGTDARIRRSRLLPVGRLRYYYKWPGHGGMLWNRLRYWPTRRRVLRIRGEYNPKTLRREKTIVDKRPIWWLLGLLALAHRAALHAARRCRTRC